MMKLSFFRNKILLSILLPVLLSGIIVSLIVIYFFTPKIFSYLKDKNDSLLRLSSGLGLDVCDNHFNSLLELRLENDPEMLFAMKNDAIESIKAISKKLHSVNLLIIDEDLNVIASSYHLFEQTFFMIDRNAVSFEGSNIILKEVGGERIFSHSLYFPFWQWHIVSFMYEKDYLMPIIYVKRLSYYGTFGVFIIMCLTLLAVFNRQVNLPLRRLIHATEGVSQGKFDKIESMRNDEIGHVTMAFNAMVENIDAIMTKLKESEKLYRILTENSLACIMIIQDYRVVYANRRAIESAGYKPDKATNISLQRLIHPDDQKMFQEKLADIIEGQSSFDYFEFRIKTRNHEIKSFEILVVPLIYKGEKSILGHAIEITEKKKFHEEQVELEAKLRQAEKLELIGTVAGGVAHDLNNVLSGIVSYPDLILMDIPENSPLIKPIMTMKKSGEKAAAIVQDLLTLTRRGVAVTNVLNLNDVISDYLQSPEFKKTLSYNQNLEIVTDLDRNLLNIIGSPVHLFKTVMNLMSNASEAMPDGGKVILSSKNEYIDTPVKGYDNVKEGDYVTFSVSDTGIGISQKDLPRIFEPFYTKKVMGRSGTGLGMAVVWGTVKDHNGYIDVLSTEGKGTTFTLYFPATRKNLEVEDSHMPLENYSGHGELVLIIDDISEQREIAGVMLNKLGYNVASVSSGEEAIEYMKKERADILVLDMIMTPGIDGLETYRQICRLYPGQKAIIASGFSETDKVAEAQRLGAGAYIKKPYLIYKLGEAIKKELRMKN